MSSTFLSTWHSGGEIPNLSNDFNRLSGECGVVIS